MTVSVFPVVSEHVAVGVQGNDRQNVPLRFLKQLAFRAELK